MPDDIELLNNMRMGWGWECGCGDHEMNCNEDCCPEDADKREWFCMKDDMTALAKRFNLDWDEDHWVYISPSLRKHIT